MPTGHGQSPSTHEHEGPERAFLGAVSLAISWRLAGGFRESEGI